MDTRSYIKKIEITKLWNKKNVEWHLNQDVNILAGINGSGKTTILDLVSGTLVGILKPETAMMAESVKITFNNDEYVDYRKLSENIKNFDNNTNKNIDINQASNRENAIRRHSGIVFSFMNSQMLPKQLREIFEVDVISTFDYELKEYATLQKLTDTSVKTELDLQIYLLQKKYLEYQINIGKKAIEALSSNRLDKNYQERIDYKKNLFLDIIDGMFKSTHKCIDRDKNELSFKLGEQIISPYMLSSGEKQLVIILLTALIQEDKPIVFIVDEPETSLHTDWQEKLIDNITKLNRNAQIIIATHSPSIVLEGWKNKVFEVSEISQIIDK